MRFRRDTKKAGSLGLQVDYAPLEITSGCSSLCEPVAIVFAPGYQAALHPRWGRPYAELGLLLAGFPNDGPDRGIAQGAQGADVYTRGALMWTAAVRVNWLQRNTGANAFGLQLGVSVSPKLVHPKAAAVRPQAGPAAPAGASPASARP